MKFKVDENLPVEVAECLRQSGHDGNTVNQEGLGGERDARIFEVCKREHRVLITLDTDFADIRTYPPGEYPGIVVLRLNRQDKNYVLGWVERLVGFMGVEPLEAICGLCRKAGCGS